MKTFLAAIIIIALVIIALCEKKILHSINKSVGSLYVEREKDDYDYRIGSYYYKRTIEFFIESMDKIASKLFLLSSVIVFLLSAIIIIESAGNYVAILTSFIVLISVNIIFKLLMNYFISVFKKNIPIDFNEEGKDGK